jgi:predicted negative regulator of RcsB-dependent stress response
LDVYQSEQEQVEALRKWWQENGKSVFAGIILGLGAIFGWRAWQDHVRQQAEAASDLYQQMIVAAGNEADTEAVKSTATELIRDYGTTTYAVFASLLLAQVAVNDLDYATAAMHLRKALIDNGEADLEPLIRLRLARVLVANEEYDAALAEMKVKNKGAFSAAYDELEGDINTSMGNIDAARTAYQLAIEKYRQQQTDTVVLEMKLDNLGHARL